MDKKAGFEVTADRPMGPNIFWLEVAPKGVQTRLVLYPKSMMQGSEGMKASIVFECENVMETYNVEGKWRVTNGKPRASARNSYFNSADAWSIRKRACL